MENPTKAPLHKTELSNRTLWFDGDSSYTPAQLLSAIRTSDVKYVNEMVPMVQEYNRNVSKEDEIVVKDHCRPLDLSWNIPEKYKNLDVIKYLVAAHDILFEGTPAEELIERERRLAVELVQFKRRGLFDVLRTIIWIINTLSAHDVVWGIGRGSSVSSYVLYVIGVHDVDSFAYQLDINDFLHD